MINGYDRMKNWLWIIGLFFVLSLHAEDGHRLWLRMERNAVPADVRLVEGTRRTAILDIASRELKDFWKGEGRVLLCVSKGGATRDGFTIRKTAACFMQPMICYAGSRPEIYCRMVRL